MHPRTFPLAVLTALTLVALALPAPFVAAQDGGARADQLKLTTERVVVFKDGYGLVISTATATADANGVVFTDKVPTDAVLGCMWAALVNQPAGTLAMRADWDETIKRTAADRPCVSIKELLRANAGRADVMLDLTPAGSQGPNREVTGTLIGLLEHAGDRERFSDQKLLEALRNSNGASESTIRPDLEGGELVVMETANGKMVLPVSQVQRVRGPGLVTTTSEQTITLKRAKRLEFMAGKENAGKAVTLRLYWFAPGVRWIPTYRISGELVDSADMSLQADVVNDLADMDAATWHLVVGVPNFRFKDTRSPLTLEGMARRAVAQVAQQFSNGNDFSNSIRSQVASNQMFDPVEQDGGMELSPELTAGGSQDMFIYTVPGLSLRKGARATVPIWQGSVPLKHVYTMDVSVRRNARSGETWSSGDGSRGGDSPLHLAVNKVWHQLQLTNNSGMPWTTGAALIMKEHVPLAQELLTYTSAGGKVEVPVTVAVDIRGDYDETETGREANALNWAGYSYAKIRKHASVVVTNFRKEASTMRIRVRVGGQAENVSDEGKLTVGDFAASDWQDWGYAQPNPHCDATWTFELAPGATKKLSFDFHYFTR
ncbi:MAG: hypothetical protein AB7K09_01745 [Planctomycetota bacterium]